jgi:hypothetical protein
MNMRALPWVKIHHSTVSDSNFFIADHCRYYAFSPAGYFPRFAQA